MAELVAVADRLSERMDARADVAEEIKAIKSAGKALGFDMGAVEQLIRLRDPEKRAAFMERMRAMGDYAEALGVEME
jgi:hypothetical protein